MQTQIKAVVIDDEQASIELLSLYLKNYCPNVELLAAADNFNDGYQILYNHQPDLVFLDIELNDKLGGGIELIEKYNNKDIAIIFFTAYSQYVQESYRLNAVYYIQKPISPSALQNAVQRAMQKISAQTQIIQTKEEVNIENFYKLSTIKGIEHILFENIAYLKADGANTFLHTTNSKYKISSETLGQIEKKLPVELFFRVHRSYVVHKKNIKLYNKIQHKIILYNDKVIPISRKKIKAFLKWYYMTH